MIFDKIQNIPRYSETASAPLAAAFKLLSEAPFNDVPDGRYEVNGPDLFYNVETYTTKPLAEGLFEAHKNYIDIQLITQGTELLAYTPLNGLKVAQEYCPKKDIAFYHPNGHTDSVILTPGSFCMLHPEDAHMPCRTVQAPTKVRKVVIKVKI
ncbi:MAG: YhcH/YjgK/YiaL family protein [Anaerohalosphaera sp.]|nr:YhcH/YjgK/YiaL family protein [Anaerohalosphaera sp.]